MSKPTNKHKVIAAIIQNVHKKDWECIVDCCKEKAINSHLLQRNGILENVSVNGHLIEYKQKDPFSWKADSPPFEMKRIGIKKALSLSLFCKVHDNLIFKEIEIHPLDLDLYRVHLLLSYRVVCAEIRKKQINVEQFSRFINAESLKGEIGLERLKRFKEGNELGIIDLKRYKNIFEDELKNESSRFTFKVYKYTFLDIYGAAVFTTFDNLVTDLNQEMPLNSIFIYCHPR